MSAAYSNAAFPEPFRILGIQLKPLSLGRYRLLEQSDVAFVSEAKRTAKPEDLLLGIPICSMDCDEFMGWASSKAFTRDLKAWSKKVSKWPWIGRLPGAIGRWWRKNHTFDMREKMQLFARYIRESSVLPKVWDVGDAAGTSSGHWSQNMEVTLRSQLGWSREEINEAPLTKAIADYFKFAETQGIVRLITEDEIASGEENAKILQAALGKLPTSNSGSNSESRIENREGGQHGA